MSGSFSGLNEANNGGEVSGEVEVSNFPAFATEQTLVEANNKIPANLTVVDGRLLVENTSPQIISGEVEVSNFPDFPTEETFTSRIPSNLTVIESRLLVRSILEQPITGDVGQVGIWDINLPPDAATETTLSKVNDKLMPTTGTFEEVSLGSSIGRTIKSSPGHIFNVYCCNIRESLDSTFSQINATTVYFQLFNSANDFTNLIRSYPVYPNNGVLLLGQDFFGGEGLFLSNGITWGISSTPLEYNAVALSQSIVNIRYK